jgi:hypothetical protein
MKPTLNIDRLTYEELLNLNRQIVARIKSLRAARDFRKMLDFNVGNTVEFWSQEGRLVRGTVSRLNQKTVSVVTPEGEKWRVPPDLLKRSGSGPGYSEEPDHDFIDIG